MMHEAQHPVNTGSFNFELDKHFMTRHIASMFYWGVRALLSRLDPEARKLRQVRAERRTQTNPGCQMDCRGCRTFD